MALLTVLKVYIAIFWGFQGLPRKDADASMFNARLRICTLSNML